MTNIIGSVTHVKSYDELLMFYKALPEGKDYKWLYRGDKFSGDNGKLLTSIEKAFKRYGVSDRDRIKSEWDIIREFQRKLHLYNRNIPPREDILDWLALMQHYGAPTRFLDCTYSFWVAVHFAITRRRIKERAEVWAINSRWFFEKNSKFMKSSAVSKVADKMRDLRDLAYMDAEAITDNAAILSLLNKPKKLIYAVNPFRLNERLTIQQGVFLCYGDIRYSFIGNLNAEFKVGCPLANVQRVVINVSPEERLKIVEHIRKANINNAVLFPGLDGFAQSLWTRVGLSLEKKLFDPNLPLEYCPHLFPQ
jgi:hypothetical protein